MRYINIPRNTRRTKKEVQSLFNNKIQPRNNYSTKVYQQRQPLTNAQTIKKILVPIMEKLHQMDIFRLHPQK